MLAAGIASRILSGWLSDTIGGLRTLLLGSVLQCACLALFVPFDSVGSLYTLSILIGFLILVLVISAMMMAFLDHIGGVLHLLAPNA